MLMSRVAENNVFCQLQRLFLSSGPSCRSSIELLCVPYNLHTVCIYGCMLIMGRKSVGVDVVWGNLLGIFKAKILLWCTVMYGVSRVGQKSDCLLKICTAIQGRLSPQQPWRNPSPPRLPPLHSPRFSSPPLLFPFTGVRGYDSRNFFLELQMLV